MTVLYGNKPRKDAGYALSVIGFLMIVANALEYLLDWDAELLPLMIIGLAFVAVGMSLSVRR